MDFWKKYKKTKFFVALLVIALVGVIGYKFYTAKATSSKEVVTVTESQVNSGDITIGFSGDGSAEIKGYYIDFEVSGKVKEIYVKEGDVIKKGQVLAKLDDTDYVNKLKSAEIAYKKAQLNYNQAIENSKLNLMSEKQKLDEYKRALAEAEKNYNSSLEMKDYYSAQEIEQYKNTFESAKANYQNQLAKYNMLLKSNSDVESAKLNLDEAKLNYELAKDNLDKTVLKSPVDATIFAVSKEVGDYAAANSSDSSDAATNSFIIASNSNKAYVVIPVSETDLPKVKIGQSAEVSFEAYEGEKFSGKVVSIKSIPETDQNGVVSYDVKVEIDNAEKIKNGMTCSVTFLIKQQKNVLIIPNKAVSFSDGKQTVKVKKQDGSIEVREITTGLTDGKNVAVTSGLNMGETVLIEKK